MGKLFVITAPSGAGKTSLVTALIERIGQSHALSRVVTYTTKAPRVGDVDGVDYCFMSTEQFEQKIKEDFFIEWSLAYGNYYGSPKNILSLLGQGSSFLLIIDRQGAQQVKAACPETVLIWICVPTIEILEQRLLSRKTENNEQINKRILLAQKEIEEEGSINFFKYKVYNDIFEKALQELESIVKNELVLPPK